MVDMNRSPSHSSRRPQGHVNKDVCKFEAKTPTCGLYHHHQTFHSVSAVRMADMELKKERKKAACLIIASSCGHHFEPTRRDSLNSMKTNLCSFSSKDRTGRCGTQQNVLLGRKRKKISIEAEVCKIFPVTQGFREFKGVQEIRKSNKGF